MNDSERIKKILEYTGLSANKFSKTIGLNTSQNIYDIINGKHGISKVLAETITVKYLNIDKIWLLTGEGEMLKKDDINFHKNILNEPMEKYGNCKRCEQKDAEISRLKHDIEKMEIELRGNRELIDVLKSQMGINKQVG
jgi:hypothetical protein